MARHDRQPSTPQPNLPDSPSDRWILSHHDAWSRATLSPLFVSLAHGTLDPELFSRWLLDRVSIARALVPACERVRGMLRQRGIEFPVLAVAQEEAEFLETYALRHGLDVNCRWRLSYDASRVVELVNSATDDAAGGVPMKVADNTSAGGALATTSVAAPETSGFSALGFLPGAASAVVVSDSVNAAPGALASLPATGAESSPVASPVVHVAPVLGLTPGSHASLCVAVAATWSFLFASWQAHSLSRRNAPISGSGPHPTHSEMRHYLSREEALVRIVETQGVLDSLLNVTGNPADLSKAQKTFEELLLRRVAALDAALESGAKEGRAPLCEKCGRKGHTGDRCTFKSHV